MMELPRRDPPDPPLPPDMAPTPQLHRLSEADLDALMDDLRQQGTTALILLGPGVRLPSADLWPQDWRGASTIYQLKQPVDALAERLAGLTQLTTLDLWGNQIGAEGAAALAPLTQLTSLALSDNPIGAAAPIATLQNLHTLNLKNTQVQDLSPLQYLLEGGLEAKWEKEDEKFVRGINVYGCPLIHPPPEIVQQGQEAVLNYLREIKTQGLDHLYEAKVLILGDGGTGKTSLLRRLYQADRPLPEEEESTKGIDIHSHVFTNAAGRPFRLNVWDFGGQQIYHATHQFFLTKRSLYILVDDTRTNSKTAHDEGFKTWLETIEALSDHSPVLIFQNEKAGRSKSIDEAGIKGHFPNVKDVYRGNLDRTDAAAALAEAIGHHVQRLPHVGEAVPAQWLAIRSALEEMKRERPYISRKEYLELYGRHLEPHEGKALKLSRYLHDLGVFLHFQEERLLARWVILQNDWATEAVFKVLDDEPTKARSGYFTLDDCQRIWAASTYADMHPELLALVESFELCYKVSDQHPETWLTPQLLPPSAPEALKAWAAPDDLVLTYHYDFLPRGLISRLMVRMHRFVRQPDCSWGSGAFFEHGQSQVLARLSSPSGQEIELRARGPEGQALLNVIASDLDALNARFEGLRHKVRKLVPCPCDRCRQSPSPQRYEEGHLRRRKQHGKQTIECPMSFAEVSVLRLLEGLKVEAPPPWAQPAPSEPPGTHTRQSPSDAEIQQTIGQARYVAASATGSASIQVINHFPSGAVRSAAATLGSGDRKTIKIFLASSSEIREDRDAFELHFRQANDRWLQKGIYLRILRWETSLDAMGETRLQDEYNKAVSSCDIFLSLFKTKTGTYTEEEFDEAHRAFQACGKPLIYTYFMQAEVLNHKRLREDLNSLWAFQDKLSNLGHYHATYATIDDLKLQFQNQLEQLLETGRL